MEEKRDNLEETVKRQAEQIGRLETEIRCLKKELTVAVQFPKVQLSLLKKYNGLTSHNNAGCFVLYQGKTFGLFCSKLSKQFGNKSEVGIRIAFQGAASVLAKGKLWDTGKGICILELKESEISKEIQEHTFPLSAVGIMERIEPGTKLAGYVPGLQIVTGYCLEDKMNDNGEVQCQLMINEAYSGSLVFDESALPIGICVGVKNPLQEHFKANHIDSEEVITAFPLAVKSLISSPSCKILGLSKVIEELNRIIKLKEEELEKGKDLLYSNTIEKLQQRLAKSVAFPINPQPILKTEDDFITHGKFEEFDEEEVKKAKDLAVVEEFIELDIVSNNLPSINNK